MKKREIIGYILNCYKKYCVRIVIIFICMIIIAILGGVSPLVQEKLFDDGILYGDILNVTKYTGALILIFIFEKIFEYVQFIHSEYISKEVPYKLLYDAIDHSLKMRLSYFKDNNFSKIINNIYEDITEITDISNTSILESLISVFKILGGIVGLLIINWKLTLFVLTIIPLEIVISNFFSGKRQELYEKLMKYNENFSTWFSETFNGIEILKLWGMQKRRQKEFVQLRRRIIDIEKKIDYIDNFTGMASSFNNMFFTNGLAFLGAVLIFRKELTIGGLFAFSAYSMYVMEPISILANIIYRFSSGYPAFKRFFEYLKNETEEEEGELINFSDIYKITFEKVYFCYDNKEPIINGLSFDIKQGEKVAFVGNNGSGKSTIINLLLRFFEVEKGKIKINDIDISDIKLNDYRNLFSVMNQNLFLFEDTLKNNIDINNDLSDEQINSYLELLHANEFVDALPEGLDTYAGYNGAKLSGGEKQKIVLIRTLCRMAPVLVLDEVTASFDLLAENQFDKYIRNTHQYQMIIVISHRINILKQMDKIFVLEKGSIIAEGTFDDLIKNNNKFFAILEESEKNHEYSN